MNTRILYKVVLLIIGLVCLQPQDTQAQGKVKEVKEDEPKGKPILTVFANYHTGINEGNSESAMEIRRAYLGYQYKISDHFKTVVKVDIGSPNDESQYSLLKRYAYFKNAALIYTNGKWNVQAGLIDLYQFKLQEKFWGHRYIEKSFMDLYKFGSSADIGTNIKYQVLKSLSVDFTVVNGEGYKQLQSDNSYKAALGLTYQPTLVKGLTLRVYGDYEDKQDSQYTLSSFVGYRKPKTFYVAGEYNFKGNYKFLDGKNLEGFSTYGGFYFFKKWEVFGRYDYLFSNREENVEGEMQPWHLADDGSKIIAGVQYSVVKGVKMSVNYQDWVPYAKNLDNEAFIFFNLEYKLP